MILAVSNVVWLLGTVGVALFLAAVTSLWNYAAMRQNRRDHSDIESRLRTVERILDRIMDRLYPFGGDDD